MKQKYLTIFAIIMMVAGIGAVSCQEKTTDGGPDDQPVEVADVYFSAENGDYCYYVGANGSAEATLQVFRKNSSIAAEYAIQVISADSGIEIPESVKFAEGQAETTLLIKAPASAATGSVLSFEIMFTGDNVNASANSTEGTIRCEGTFYYYQEIVSAANLMPYTSSDIDKMLGDIRQVIWKLDASNYLIKDFLGSGSDLKVVLDPATNNISALVYDKYELYAETDEYGGVIYSFWSDEDEAYEVFAPKGDRRQITKLVLYVDSGYAGYMSGNVPCIFFTIYSSSIYSEADNVNKTYSWQYLCFFFYSDETLNSLDFIGFPEITKVTYPEAIYSEEAKDGKVPVQFFLDNEQIYLDTQYAEVTADGYVFSDFMMSGYNVTIVPNGATFTFVVKDAAGNVIPGEVSDGYNYLGMEYLSPWSAKSRWSLYGLSMYNDSQYCIWDEATSSATFYASYSIYNGDTGAYLDGQLGYIDIYW